MSKLDLEAIRERVKAAQETWQNEPALLANARQDIPTLLAEVERLRRKLHDTGIALDERRKMYDSAVKTLTTEIVDLRSLLGELVAAGNGMLCGKPVFGLDGTFPLLNHPNGNAWASEWFALKGIIEKAKEAVGE